MDLELTGKRAFISGSTAGIGLAIAVRLAAEGAEVILSGRSQARVDEGLARLAHAVPGARASGIATDLSTAEGARLIMERVPDVDILVNNLGVYPIKSFADCDDAAWESLLQTNLFSGIRLSRHYLPRMLARTVGRIVFISSESAVNIPPDMLPYGVSKTAQTALARGLAELTVGTQVTVNSVLAGPTRTENVDAILAQNASASGVSVADIEKSFVAQVRPTSLLKRFGTPAEVADVVAFLASPRAAVINGAAVRADGGVVRSVF